MYFMFFTHTVILINMKYISRLILSNSGQCVLFRNSRTFQDKQSNSRTFRIKQSNSRAFQYCTNYPVNVSNESNSNKYIVHTMESCEN